MQDISYYEENPDVQQVLINVLKKMQIRDWRSAQSIRPWQVVPLGAICLLLKKEEPHMNKKRNKENLLGLWFSVTSLDIAIYLS